jgi:multicomponent Na+:H+ antiporter subunit D
VSWLLPLPVAVPLLGAALIAVTDHVVPRRVKNVMAIAAAAVATAVSLTIMLQAQQGLVVHWFGGWHPHGKVAIGIGFVADPF